MSHNIHIHVIPCLSSSTSPFPFTPTLSFSLLSDSLSLLSPSHLPPLVYYHTDTYINFTTRIPSSTTLSPHKISFALHKKLSQSTCTSTLFPVTTILPLIFALELCLQSHFQHPYNSQEYVHNLKNFSQGSKSCPRLLRA